MFTFLIDRAYSEINQTSKMERFVNPINGLKPF